MYNPKDKKKNSIATATFLLLGTILIVASVSTSLGSPILPLQSADANNRPIPVERSAQAPVVVSGDNIYIAWWTNNTANGNEEVMFRASNDGGATFGDKINLSNTTNADSWRVEIAGEGETVVVSWWETNSTDSTTTAANQTTTEAEGTATNQTAATGGAAASPQDIPVARVSNDAGATFGPLLMLGMNGTLGSGEAEGIAAAGEGGEEG